MVATGGNLMDCLHEDFRQLSDFKMPQKHKYSSCEHPGFS